MRGWASSGTSCSKRLAVPRPAPRPDAQANLAKIPAELKDEEVLMCPDIMSTGISGAESGGVRVGDAVAIFAQGPIGLCATAGARLCGASLVIAVESVR